LASFRSSPRLRIATALTAGALLLSLIFAPDALANFITPKSGGSPNANHIATLYKIVLYIAAVVLLSCLLTVLLALVERMLLRGRNA